MRRRASLAVLPLLVTALGVPGGASAQQPGGPPTPRTTIWDSVYTAEQATRGERTAYVNCFSCHTAADWTSSHFLDPTSDQRLGDLFQMISRQMPMDSPGKLSPAEYADVIAYMLKLQGAPPGEKELMGEVRQLDRIFVARPRRD
jgi:mono/diheme cytochrome c family protein